MPFPTPNGEQTFVDLNGDPYVGGSVFSYVPGTSDPSPTYTDQTLSVPNPNPVVLDAAGRAVMWTDLITRQVLYDMFGNLIWDRPTGIEIDQIYGNLTIAGNLTVDGNSQFNGSGTFDGLLTANGGETVNGPFNATGGATISGTLTTNNINNSGNINTSTLDASGLITAGGGLTANGPITANDGITAPGGFTGNVTVAPGSCVVTNCIESNGAQYISVNANLYVTQQANGALNAMIIQSPDPASYTDFYGRGILMVSNDNPYIAMYNTFGPFLPWVMWGGVAAFNWGLSNSNNGDPSVAGSTQLMSLDDAGNLTIIGTLTQGAVAADSPLMADGALALVNAAVVHNGGVEAPALARSVGGVNEAALIGVLWKAVQELSAKVTA